MVINQIIEIFDKCGSNIYEPMFMESAIYNGLYTKPKNISFMSKLHYWPLAGPNHFIYVRIMHGIQRARKHAYTYRYSWENKYWTGRTAWLIVNG